jgi:hypothetical protein
MTAVTTENEARIEKAKAEQLIAESPIIDVVENYRVELGEDQTGDPAMWLVFRLKPGTNFDTVTADRFIDYAGAIQTKIIHSGLKRFPYTRLE